jgi:hypothetical protein
MFTFTSRELVASIAVAVASFSGSPASAELRHQVVLQELGPTAEESGDHGSFTERTEFGYDVAIRNGLAFVGMPWALGTGRVAVFTQGASGWVRSATITASDMTTDDEFGRAVSFRDGLLIVGSKRAAYVYKRVNGVWREQQKIVPPAADGMAQFARTLKHEAGILAIGAFDDRDLSVPPTTADSVYVFEQDATGRFVRRARLTSDSGHFRDGFGGAIDMTNVIIVVGSEGAAYILGRNSNGNWVRRQKLVGSGEPGGFGAAVAVDRGMILVGAPGTIVPGREPLPDDYLRVSGVVYGFLPGATRYVEAFKLEQRLDEFSAYQFGQSIAMRNDRIAVGASEEFDFIFRESGLPGFVLTYSRDGSIVRPLGIASGGASVDIANNVLLIGSPLSGYCPFQDSCAGAAALLDLNRFAQ